MCSEMRGGLRIHRVLLRVWARLVGRIRVRLLVGIEERRGGPAERRAASARGILGSFRGVVHIRKRISYGGGSGRRGWRLIRDAGWVERARRHSVVVGRMAADAGRGRCCRRGAGQ